ncbi:MAG: hypothetical protein Q8Q73_14820 [Stagnimonas sp.]|nr:hypothetical protein [Stagnimonas sp.]
MKKTPDLAVTLRAPPDWPYPKITVNIVTMRQGKEWISTVLEMDLQAVGATRDESLGTVREMFIHQVAFAVQKKEPALIFRHAEPYYWELFHEHRRRLLSAMVTGQPSNDDDVHVDSMPVDQGLISQHLKRSHKPYQRHHAA